MKKRSNSWYHRAYMKANPKTDPEKYIRAKTDPDERTMQMLLVGLDSLRKMVDQGTEVLEAEKTTGFETNACASQKVQGLVNACTMICGETASLRRIAEGYVGAQFIETDEDVMDAVCELINTANGVFARSITEEDEDLEPPFFRHAPSIVKGEKIYALTVKVCGAKVRFCIAYNPGIAAA
ncbi:MAG: chemotaxis protein CheX [Lachnospiraceae bacterium]|nr:chemotaxis protein CheX [Lachnospiraceae bacterium]